MTLLRHIWRPIGGTAALRVTAMSLTLLGTVILARLLGAANYGVYAFVLAVVNVVAIPTQIGLPALIVRETARAQAEENWGAIKALWTWAFGVVLRTSVAALILGVAILLMLRSELGREKAIAFCAGLVLLPMLVVGDLSGAALRGLKRVIAGQLSETVARPGLLFLLAAVAWAAFGQVEAYAGVLLNATGAAVAAALGLALVAKYRHSQWNLLSADHQRVPEWRRALLPLALLNSAQIINAQAGVIVLGAFGYEVEAGLYKVAASTAALSVFGLQVANIVIQPHIAQLFAHRDLAALNRLAGKAALAATAFTLPCVLVVLLFGRLLLRWLFGAEFEDAWIPLVTLSIGQLVNAAFGSVALLLSMTGHERIALRWLAIAAALNVGASVLLVPLFGATGAAIACATSIVFWNIAFWIAARRSLGVDGSLWGALRRSGSHESRR